MTCSTILMPNTNSVSRCEISLSVVVYRDYETPLNMIRSLLYETCSSLDFQLYIVDNSSLPEGDCLEDAKRSFKQEIEKTAHCVYVDSGNNLGFGAANNIALGLANSEYHAFVNPDVVFVEDALSNLKKFMDRNREIGMCIPRMTDEMGKLLSVYRREVTVVDAFNRMVLKNRFHKRDRYHTMQGEDYSRPFRVPFGQGSFLFGRTSLLKGLGGFDESFFMYLEDADLCRRINEVSSLYYCPDATVVHKWERGSHRDLRLFMEHFRSYLVYFRKWGLKIA